MGQVMRALAFATHKHRDQRRMDVDASPYINHPIALANVLCNEAGLCDPLLICAALLHDTLEETGTTGEELEEAFDKPVKDIVLEVTLDKRMDREERRRVQREQAMRWSINARLVMIADKICNLRDVAFRPPADWSLAERQDYFDWAKEVVDSLRGTHERLEFLFDEAFRHRPREERSA
jgi:guanosine-3',5'-bis(diphosphate) 3'-pyrophosphohydrolase